MLFTPTKPELPNWFAPFPNNVVLYVHNSKLNKVILIDFSSKAKKPSHHNGWLGVLRFCYEIQ